VSRGRPVACWAALILLAAGCGVDSQDSADLVPAEQLPAPLRAATPSSASRLPSSVSVYLVGRGGRLVATTVDAAQSTPRTAMDALLAISGPQGGLRNAVPPGTRLRSAELRNGVLSIDVSEELGLVRGPDQVLALAQIVWTVTEFPEAERVRIGVGGRYVAVPTDSGRTTTDPVGRESYRSVGPG
jgi:spore germination protein GerM